MKKIISDKIKPTKELLFSEILRRFFVAWLFMLFFALIIVQKDSSLEKVSLYPKQLVFVLSGIPSDWGIDMSQGQVHGAADDWNYLFEDNKTNQQVYATPTNSVDLNQKDVDIPLEDMLFSKDYFPENLNSGSKDNLNNDVEIENVFIVSGGIVDLGQDQELFCTTPWGEYVADGDFVLAYQQRKDVDNLCDVQRRFCNNGKLLGLYIQKSCKEQTSYSYIKPEAISYTQKVVDDFVQPNDPSFSGADFDIHGKINGFEEPIDVWGNPSTGIPSGTTTVSQSLNTQKSCKTPWGQIVPSGQFVKAYKTPIGLLDLPCDVEIRLCSVGNLKGTYRNRACDFKNMTYRDYLIKNYDINNPTVGDLINALDTEEKKNTYNTWSFWQWLDKYF